MWLSDREKAYNQTDLSEISADDDPGDWQLYLAAMALFRQRQREYGMPVHIRHA